MAGNKRGDYRAWLLELRRRLMEVVDLTEEALRQNVVAPGEISSVRTHPADHDSEGFVEKIAIAQNEEQILEDVEAALQRIEKGTYGNCLECGNEIPPERLQAIPYTPWCINCAREPRNERPRPK